MSCQVTATAFSFLELNADKVTLISPKNRPELFLLIISFMFFFSSTTKNLFQKPSCNIAHQLMVFMKSSQTETKTLSAKIGKKKKKCLCQHWNDVFEMSFPFRKTSNSFITNSLTVSTYNATNLVFNLFLWKCFFLEDTKNCKRTDKCCSKQIILRLRKSSKFFAIKIFLNLK